MQIVANGKWNYQKLLRFSSAPGKACVASLYLLRLETEDGALVCNTLTGELALLSPEEKRFLDSLPGEMDPAFSQLASHRFIVPEGCREDETAGQLRSLLMKRREAAGAICHYNILPTTFCNARCFYCFESGIRHVHMSPETAEELVRFIAAHCSGQAVRLSWFGGEPMLGRERIDQICGRLKEMRIPYQSEMTSNGYLFDEALAKHAREQWNLKKIQITLDGTEDVYNRTKAYPGVRDNPFKRVLRNIRSLLENGIRVNIRLNLDLHNGKDLAALIGELKERFGGNPDINVYIQPLVPEVGFDPVSHGEEEQAALKLHLQELRKMLEKEGWQPFRTEKLPHLKLSSCMADDPASVQCTPDGILSKCEDQIFQHTIGSLADGIVNREELLWWRERVIHAECAVCPLYPSCRYLLAHCPVNRGKCPPGEREGMISQYLKNMRTVYRQWKKTGQKGASEPV